MGEEISSTTQIGTVLWLVSSIAGYSVWVAFRRLAALQLRESGTFLGTGLHQTVQRKDANFVEFPRAFASD